MKKILFGFLAFVTLSSFGPFKENGKKVSLRLNNYDGSEVRIKVSDSEGHILFSDKFNDKEIGKLFNFEDAYPGVYHITVEDDGTTYKRSVVID